MKKDRYQTVTDAIIKDLDFGIRPWMQPWETGGEGCQLNRPLRANGAPYQGINVLMLWASAVENGFLSPTWISFKRAPEMNVYGTKVEKGAIVVHAGTLTRQRADQRGVQAWHSASRVYSVFNADQIDGLPAHYIKSATAILGPNPFIAQVERFVDASARSAY